jgi:putative sigma-54 modulation protein
VEIKITTRHVDITDEIKDYAYQKAEKLLKYYDRIQEIEVIIESEGDLFSVKIIANAGASAEFLGQDTGPDTFALIDLVEEKVERQLRKHKEKLRNHMHSPRDSDNA